MAEAEFPFVEPYALETTLFSGQAFRWKKSPLGFAGWIGGRPVTLEAGHGAIRATSPSPEAVEAAPAYLRLGDPMTEVYRSFGEDAVMARAVERWRGLHLLAQDPWETTVSFITSSASNIPRIGRTIDALCDRFGERIVANGSAAKGFPSPAAIARAPTSALLACGLGYRAAYLRSTARAVAAGDIDLEALRGAATLDAQRMLVETLDGVGPKVADCILLFSLGKDDAFPVDRWVQRQVASLYFNGKVLPPTKVAAWGRERFGRWAGYAQQYLFHGGRAGRARAAPAVKSRRYSPTPSSARSSPRPRPARAQRARSAR